MHTKNLMDLAGTTRHCSHVGLIGFLQVVESIDFFFLDLQYPFVTSGGRNHSTKKNSEYWMQDEVRQLVNVVLEYEVGKWKDVKRKYFFRINSNTISFKGIHYQ